MAEHDGRGRAQADAHARRATTSSHSRGVDLVRADDGADLVVEDLGRGARQRAQARRPSAAPGSRAAAARASPRPASPPAARRRGRACPGTRRFDRPADVEIGRRRCSRGWMPPCRQTSVAPRAQASRARRTISSSVEIVGRAAQRLVRLALGEGAERAAVGADVGVVDVAVDDVADGLAADIARAARRPPPPHAPGRRRARRTAA